MLDCGSPKSCHLFAPAAFDPKDRQSPAACTGGYADSPSPLSQLQVGVPTAYRSELIRLLLATAATGTDGSKIADPSAFLSAVQATL